MSLSDVGDFKHNPTGFDHGHVIFRRTFTFTDGLVRVFSNEFLPLVAARNIGLTALDLFPPARRLLLKQATGAAGNVPNLCRESGGE